MFNPNVNQNGLPVQQKYPTKPKGWHSRRHQTREAQDKARAQWMALKSPQTKREMATEMMIARATRSAPVQLMLIANRRGKSRREVARLKGALKLAQVLDAVQSAHMKQNARK